jgi:hypothetical protein
VVFIYREEVYVPDGQQNRAELIVDKHRDGPEGTAVVHFNKRFALFQDSPAITAEESLAHRRRLVAECQALEMPWERWLLHPRPLEELWSQVDQQAGKLGFRPADRELLRLARETLASGRPLERQVREELGTLLRWAKATRPARQQLVQEVLDANDRLKVLVQVREEALPALLAGRFAIFAGPSGRGKSLMARIVQWAAIMDHGVPAVYLNWRSFVRQIKGTFDGNGVEAEVWRQTRSYLTIVDDPDKDVRDGTAKRWTVESLYDLFEERMALSQKDGRARPLLLVLNQEPRSFGDQLSRYGQLGVAAAQRGLQRSRPVCVEFGEVPVWVQNGETLL